MASKPVSSGSAAPSTGSAVGAYTNISSAVVPATLAVVNVTFVGVGGVVLVANAVIAMVCIISTVAQMPDSAR
ncbi:MAG: hypothetical protein RSF86_11370 [Angelakisella sp.]